MYKNNNGKLTNLRISINATSYRPLLYGLSIEENFKVLHSYQFASKDYQITPGSPWNYAIQLSGPDPEKAMEVIVDGLKPNLPPFSQQGAPVKIQAKVGQCLLISLPTCMVTLFPF